MRQCALVTGASGFVGRAVVARLAADGWHVRSTTRRRGADSEGQVETVANMELHPATNWAKALDGVDLIVHCGARVHKMRDSAADPLAEYRLVNTAATAALARQGAAAGVRRFVFLSTIGVNGPETHGLPFRPDDPPAPHTPYALSKLEAELELGRIGNETGIEIVVIRPPLVYGPEAPGNFARLLLALWRGIPLPLGAIHNRRSLVALGNLVDLIASAAAHEAAANRTLLVCDDEDVSTPDLLRRIGFALGRPARLLPVPVRVIRGAALLVGRPELAQQLCASLQIDLGATRSVLGWKPPVRVTEALEETAQHFIARQSIRR
jgi:UDP-4-keto-D-QuiNAc 4-reductase